MGSLTNLSSNYSPTKFPSEAWYLHLRSDLQVERLDAGLPYLLRRKPKNPDLITLSPGLLPLHYTLYKEHSDSTRK